jgi:hypothetical protein
VSRECHTEGCISAAVTRLVVLDEDGQPTHRTGPCREACVEHAADLNRMLRPVYTDGSPAYRWERIK